MSTDNMHVHQFRKTVVPPTCRSNGYTLYSCDCGYEHKTEFKPAVDHSFEVTQAIQATCTEEGSMTSVCSGCGETQVKPIPPLGHVFDKWIIKSYPTCTEPGLQYRKCRRCSEIEEQEIAPTGHRCAPGTARYENGHVAEFFCENCGQTVQCEPPAIREKANTARYLPTMIALIATAVMTLLRMIFMVLCDMYSIVSFTYPWVAYSFPAVMLLSSTLFALFARSIRAKERYTRWTGAAMLAFAVPQFFSLLGDIDWLMEWRADYYENVMQAIADNLPMFFSQVMYLSCYLLLAVIFFSGMKKKTWVFVGMLVFTGMYVTAFLFGDLPRLFGQYEWFNEWYLPYNITSSLSIILFTGSLSMLLIPNRKSKEEAPVSE